MISRVTEALSKVKGSMGSHERHALPGVIGDDLLRFGKLVINRQLWLYHDSGDAGLTHLYRMRDAQLWSHIEFHPECNAIYAALD